MATKELKLWYFTHNVLGLPRLIMVLDGLVSGADKRLPGIGGLVHLKNCMVGDEIPAWVRETGPGVFISTLPVHDRSSRDPNWAGLDRYSVGVMAKPPAMMPSVDGKPVKEVFVHADDLPEATGLLAGVQQMALTGCLSRPYHAVKLVGAGALVGKAG